MSTGYGMRFECDPATGRVSLSQHGSTAANEVISQATTTLYIEPNGNFSIGTLGSNAKMTILSNQKTTLDNTLTLYNPALGTNQSHVHFGLKGDWYIRSAANDGKVVIQDNAGGVCIGTSYMPNGYKLAVQGRVICEELKVQLRNAWPDYVFASDYKLKPLDAFQCFRDACFDGMRGYGYGSDYALLGVALRQYRVTICRIRGRRKRYSGNFFWNDRRGAIRLEEYAQHLARQPVKCQFSLDNVPCRSERRNGLWNTN